MLDRIITIGLIVFGALGVIVGIFGKKFYHDEDGEVPAPTASSKAFFIVIGFALIALGIAHLFFGLRFNGD